MKTKIFLPLLALMLTLCLLAGCATDEVVRLEGADKDNDVQNGGDDLTQEDQDQDQDQNQDLDQGQSGNGENTNPGGTSTDTDQDGSDSQQKPTPNPDAGIYPDVTALTLTVGQSAKIQASVIPAFAGDSVTVVFTASDESVATVDREGNVTAKAKGSIQISLQCGNLTAYCAVTVIDDRNDKPGIYLEADTVRVLKGKSRLIEAVFVPARQNDDATLVYESSDPSVVSVNGSGQLTAHTNGSATITLSDKSGTYRKSLKVTVPQSLSFLAAGDNLLHSGIYNDARERAGGSGYDFLPIYNAIADKVQNADFAMINQEGVFSGDSLSSYPKLNGPQEGIKALADLGFDIISLANNHCLDKGGAGLSKSMSYLDTLKDVIRIGGYFKKNNDALKTRVIEKDGIKVALLAYTTFTNGDIPSDYNSSGVYVPWVEPYENTIDDINRAKNKADVVLVFMHWGDEEQFEITGRQKEIAKMLADNGVDIIVGAHPHVIQPVEYIEAQDGRQVPCVYSLGTLVSNMATEQNMLSCLLSFDFVKDTDTGKVTVENILMDPYVFYYNMNYRESALYRLTDMTDELANSHGIGNYPKDSSVKNTMSISRLYGYLKDNISPDFLPSDIKKELG